MKKLMPKETEECRKVHLDQFQTTHHTDSLFFSLRIVLFCVSYAQVWLFLLALCPPLSSKLYIWTGPFMFSAIQHVAQDEIYMCMNEFVLILMCNVGYDWIPVSSDLLLVHMYVHMCPMSGCCCALMKYNCPAIMMTHCTTHLFYSWWTCRDLRTLGELSFWEFWSMRCSHCLAI